MKRNPATNEAFCALAKQGDADAQNLLIENNLRFIKKTAYEVWNAQAEWNHSLGIDPDDLIQEGILSKKRRRISRSDSISPPFSSFVSFRGGHFQQPLPRSLDYSDIFKRRFIRIIRNGSTGIPVSTSAVNHGRMNNNQEV